MVRKTQKFFIIFITLLLAALPACSSNPLTPTAQLISSGHSNAWFDSPVTGSTLSAGQIEIVFHGSMPAGVETLELSANDQIIDTTSFEESKSSLASRRYIWEPEKGGDYTLKVRAQDTAGNWGNPAEIEVHVIQTPVIPSATPTLEGTSMAALTATITPTYVPTQPGQIGYNGRFTEPIITPNIIYELPGCEPRGITTQLEAIDADGIRNVTLFYRIVDSKTNEFTSWKSIEMINIQADLYKISFEPVTDGGFQDWVRGRISTYGTTWEGWVYMQYVILDATGQYTRSLTYIVTKIKTCQQ